MENRKIQYQFNQLPMLLFIACLTVTVVAASHHKSEVSFDNLYSPIYYGDSNVTEGKHFWISCRAEQPIFWYKDGEPIENGLVRHGKEEFTYTIGINEREDLKEKVESKLSVSHAVLRHKGKYQCNVNHNNAHYLHVHPAPSVMESEEISESFAPFESENDHEDHRVSFERRSEDEMRIPSTLMSFTVDATATPDAEFSPDTEPLPDYDEDKSHENFVDEPTTFDDLNSPPYETTPRMSVTSTSLPITSLTDIPFHPTKVYPTHETAHSNYVVHSTHVIPSEVKMQDQLDKIKGALSPDYEGQKTGFKLFKINKPLSISCKSDPSEAEKVVWMKDAKNVKDIPSLQNRYNIIAKEGKFIVDRAGEEDAGNYTCSLGESSFSFNTYAAVVVKVVETIYVIEEEKLEITCSAKGTFPTVSWEFRPESKNVSESINDEDRYKFSAFDGIEDAKLTIEKSALSDRGYYTCVGMNELMDDNDAAKSEGFVRVKDKLAALWPFLGICAEVFILCAIILIYEKRRNKTDLEESDTDQSPDQKNDHNMKDSDVRHRK